MRRTFWGAAAAVAVAIALILTAVIVMPPAGPGQSGPSAATRSTTVRPAFSNTLPQQCYDNPVSSPACMVGAYAWGEICLSTLFSDCGVSSQQTSQELQMGQMLVGGLGNEVNGTAAMWAQEIQALAAAHYLLSDMADNAALSQLNNSTYSPVLDMAQSGVPAFISPVVQQFTEMEGAYFNATAQWVWDNYGPGGQFHGGNGYYNLGYSANGYCNGGTAASDLAATCTADNYLGVASGTNLTSGASDVYLQGGQPAVIACSLAASGGGTISSIDGGQTFYNNGSGSVLFTPKNSDVYALTGSLYPTDCSVQSAGLIPLQSTAGSIAHVMVRTTVAQAPAIPLLLRGRSLLYPPVLEYGFQFEEASGGTVTYQGYGYNANPNGELAAALNAIPPLISQAELSGQAYWHFLRVLGYTSESQIPANCVIPPPAFSLPPSSTLGAGLTANQTLNLYVAWLNSLADFYDTPMNSTTFCQGHPQWNGQGAWGNLDVNITGFIYIPGQKLLANQTLAPTTAELFGDRSSWTFNGSAPGWTGKPSCAFKANCTAASPVQFSGWPMLATVHIPIGKAWEVPANDPLTILPTANYIDLQLTGNGTDVPIGGLGASASTAGDALYVTSCTIGGVVQSGNCTLSFSGIPTYLFNITCPGCKSGGGTFGTTQLGLPNPFTWLSGLLSGLFGGGSFGSFLAGIVAALVILLVIAGLAYVAIVEIQAWGKNKRGGGAGGGGSTVVVTGGR